MAERFEKKVAGSVIRLHPDDNVVIAVHDIEPGQDIDSEGVTTLHPISAGHKVATTEIPKGEPIRKYSTVIGFAGVDIAPGSSVHNHNVVFRDIDRDYGYASEYKATVLLPENERATFQGIVREDGRVATRNFIGVCSTVNCSDSGITNSPSGISASWGKIAGWYYGGQTAPHEQLHKELHRRRACRIPHSHSCCSLHLRSAIQ